MSEPQHAIESEIVLALFQAAEIRSIHGYVLPQHMVSPALLNAKFSNSYSQKRAIARDSIGKQVFQVRGWRHGSWSFCHATIMPKHRFVVQ